MPVRHQAITWTNDDLSSIRPLGTNPWKILIQIQPFNPNRIRLFIKKDEFDFFFQNFVWSLSVLINGILILSSIFILLRSEPPLKLSVPSKMTNVFSDQWTCCWDLTCCCVCRHGNHSHRPYRLFILAVIFLCIFHRDQWLLTDGKIWWKEEIVDEKWLPHQYVIGNK